MAFLVWGLLACSGVYWLIQVAVRPLATPAQTLPVFEQSSARVDLSRLLGAPVVAAAEAAPAQESRFKLLGVVAPKSAHAAQTGEGVALIAVDGVPRTVRVGAVIEEELQLLSVDARSAQLGKGGVASVNLQLASPMQASTGALPPAGLSGVNLGGRMAPPQFVPQIIPQLPVGAMPPPQQQGENRGNPAS